MPRTGRPKKPEDEKFIGRHIKFPPALWERLEKLTEPKERAAFIREALDVALKKRERELKRQADEGTPDA